MSEELPSGWTTTPVSSIAALIRGVTYRKSEASSHPTADLVPILRAGNVRDGQVQLEEDLVYVPQDRVSDDQLLRAGDTLIATSSGSASVVGKSALVVNDWHGAHGAFMAVLRPHAGIEPAYLAYYLQSEKVRHQWRAAAAGTNINNLKRGDLLSTEVAICPVEHQRRIVAAIEEHFSRLEALESMLQGGLRSIAAMRTSLLTGAFKVDGTLPRDWQRTEIGEVARVQLGRQRSPQHHAGPQMRPYLRAANVTWDGLSLDDVKQMNFDEGDFETYRLRPGDLLLNEASGSPNEVGKPAVWNGEIENCCFQNTLLRLQARDVNPGYLYWYCYMAASTGLFGEAGRGVNIRHLGKQGLARFPIPVAPSVEQERIVTGLEAQFQQTSDCEASIHQALERLHALRRSILTRAFHGHLVARNPECESAMVPTG